MKILSQARLREQLLRDEGEILHAYEDHLGYLTIGVGHLIDVRKGGRISKMASRFLLEEDVAEKQSQLVAALPWTKSLDDARFAALVNMVFQLGIGGLLKFPKMLAALKLGNMIGVKRHALDSKWAEQTPARARRTVEQLTTGIWQK